MRDDDGGNNRSVNIGQPPAFLKPLVPALLAILTGAVVQQLQTDWGWAAILLVGAILLPLAIWLGLREPRAQRPLIRYGFPALASAYVLLTAAFSIFGDQLGWLWRISISAPIGAAAIAVLLLSRDRNSVVGIGCVAIIGLGVAMMGFGVADIVDHNLAFGFAVICAGVAAIGAGLALIVDNKLAFGVAVIGLSVAAIGVGIAVILDYNNLAIGVATICAGVAAIGIGVADMVDNRIVSGVAVIGLGVVMIGAGAVSAGHVLVLAIGLIGGGVAAIGVGVAVIVDNKLAFGVGMIGCGVAAIGCGVASIIVDNELAVAVAVIGLGAAMIVAGAVLAGLLSDQSRSPILSAERNDEARDTRSESSSINSRDVC
jgi:hypothetical protein